MTFWQIDLGRALLSASVSKSSKNVSGNQARALVSKIGGPPLQRSLCRSRQRFEQVLWSSRATITAMAYKGVSERVTNDRGKVSIDVAGKSVEVVGVSGLSEADVRHVHP